VVYELAENGVRLALKRAQVKHSAGPSRASNVRVPTNWAVVAANESGNERTSEGLQATEGPHEVEEMFEVLFVIVNP
jgi:hypothetical protein